MMLREKRVRERASAVLNNIPRGAHVDWAVDTINSWLHHGGSMPNAASAVDYLELCQRGG